ALQAAKAKGVISELNTAPITGDAVRLAKLANIVITNETEFELLTGQPSLKPAEREEALQRMHAQTGQTYIITLGADGVIAAHQGQMHRANGLAIRPVDTVGAGDTFCGYLAASIDSGIDFEQALRRA